MEDCVCDPIDLFVDIGMLITEGRIPDLSPKRRVEGPHCPSLDQSHSCDRHREQCRKADQLRKQMLMMCRNKIPMRVDVLLLPKCNHGQLEASTVEGATVSCQDTALLLERWDVQIISKRMEKTESGCVTGRFLLQAIRSYLHFSQLSSWMISSKDCLPFEVIYRLYAPGETVNYSFKVIPNVHHFPQSDMTHATMKVSVASLPRPQDMPHLTCIECGKGRQKKQDKFTKARTPHRTSTNVPLSERPHSSKSLGLDQYSLKSLESHHRRKKSDQSDHRHTKSDQSDYKHKKSDLSDNGHAKSDQSDNRHKKSDQSDNRHKKSDQSDQTKNKKSEKLDNNVCLPSRPKSPKVSDEDDGCTESIPRSKLGQQSSEGQVVPDQKLFYHKPPSGRKLKTNEEDKTCNSSVAMGTDLKKESNISMQTVSPGASSNQSQGASHFCYAKKLLKESLKVKPLSFKGDSHSKHPTDPDTLIKRLPSPKVLFTTNSKSQNPTYKKRKIDLSDLAENVEDKIMYSDLSDLMKPLHSEELESYLASLSHRVPDKVIHDSIGSIPLTKCKFFIGEHLNDIEASDRKSSCDKIDNQKDVTVVEKKDFVTDIDHVDDGIISEKDRTSDSGGNTNSSTFHKTQEKQKVFQEKVSPILHDEIIKLSVQKSSLDITDKCDRPKSGSRGRETVAKRLFKSLSEPGPDFEKLSLSLVNDGHHNSRSHDGNHGCRSHDGSPNGLSLTDDESSDNSTPTNSLSECNANHFKNEKQFTHNASPSINDVKPTSNSDGDLNDSLEEEIAKLHLSDNKCVGMVQNNSVTMVTSEKKKEDKLALGKTLCKHLMTKELNKMGRPEDISMPNQEEIMIFQRNLGKSTSMMFSTATGLPTRSSPAPTKRKSSGGRFDYDNTLISTKAIKNALSCSKLALQSESSTDHEESQKVLSTSAPASTNCLLGNFEESVLNGRIEPIGVVEGFTAEIGAGGSFCPKHITLPVTAYFFQLSDDNAPSPYLGHINLESLGKKGYKIPTCGTVQVTLFNPNKTVVKMFVVMYDMSDMPANCQTFLRQRTVYMPADTNSTEPTFLRYLIHLRFASSRSGKIYLHTDIRLIFARDKFEFDPRVANYELRSFTEGPQNPKFSPKR
ncbi:atos homolog protein A-like isoform X2 [Mytilus galloprovincialis]